jgi:hypothetical protein
MKNLDNTIWCIRKDSGAYLKKDGSGILMILGGRNIFLTRRDARLLARRINQCLDETRKGGRAK